VTVNQTAKLLFLPSLFWGCIQFIPETN